MPWSIAAFASSGGASVAAVPTTQREHHRDDAQAVGAHEAEQPAQAAPARAAGARARRPTAGRRSASDHRAHRPLTSGSRGLRVRNT